MRSVYFVRVVIIFFTFLTSVSQAEPLFNSLNSKLKKSLRKYQLNKGNKPSIGKATDFSRKASKCIKSICDKESEKFDIVLSPQEFLEGKEVKESKSFFDSQWSKINKLRQRSLEKILNFQKLLTKERISKELKSVTSLDLLEGFIQGDFFNTKITFIGEKPFLDIELLMNEQGDKKKILHNLYNKFSHSKYYQRNKLLAEYYDLDEYIEERKYESFNHYYGEQKKELVGLIKKLEPKDSERFLAYLENLESMYKESKEFPLKWLNSMSLGYLSDVYATVSFLKNHKDLSESEYKSLVSLKSDSLESKLTEVKQANFSNFYVEEKWRKTCKGAYQQAMKWSPSKDQIVKAKRMVKESKEHYLTWLEASFSKKSYELLKRAVIDYKISYPLSKQEYVNLMAGNISKYLENEPVTFFNFLDELNSSAINKEDMFLSQICNTSLQEPLSDLTQENFIKFSTFSVKNLNFGRGILYHEISHAVSHLISTIDVSKESLDKFLKLRESLSTHHSRSLNSELNYSNIRFAGDTHWTEEDWADFVSSSVTSNSKREEDNYLCVFVSEKKNYTPSDMEFGEDEHSPSLMRVIQHELRVNQKVEQSCLELKSINNFSVNDFKKIKGY